VSGCESNQRSERGAANMASSLKRGGVEFDERGSNLQNGAHRHNFTSHNATCLTNRH
jgi:hypothetical protein